MLTMCPSHFAGAKWECVQRDLPLCLDVADREYPDARGCLVQPRQKRVCDTVYCLLCCVLFDETFFGLPRDSDRCGI